MWCGTSSTDNRCICPVTVRSVLSFHCARARPVIYKCSRVRRPAGHILFYYPFFILEARMFDTDIFVCLLFHFPNFPKSSTVRRSSFHSHATAKAAKHTHTQTHTKKDESSGANTRYSQLLYIIIAV